MSTTNLAEPWSSFRRGLPAAALEQLSEITNQTAPHWWKDLLALWRPSGVEAGLEGLRLAVRGGYLNFYRLGQSIARVGFDKGRPILETHVKYAFGAAETGQRYAKLIDRKVLHPEGGAELSYDGPESLAAWIAASEPYSGREKALINEVVSANSAVVDLEMALAAKEGEANTGRIDLVALEREGDGLGLVLWEAKLMSDPRLRSRTGRPAILDQLQGYQNRVAPVAGAIAQQYRLSAQTMLSLYTMAATIGRPVEPPPALHRLADPATAVTLDPEIRLLLLNDQPAKLKSWDAHANVLRNHNVRSLIVPGFHLSGPR